MAASKELPSETLSMAERYQNLSTTQVMKYVGTQNRQTIWEYVKQGKLPKPKYISAHRPVWQLGELVDHLEKVLESFDTKERNFIGNAKTKEDQETQVRSSGATKLRQRFGLGLNKQ